MKSFLSRRDLTKEITRQIYLRSKFYKANLIFGTRGIPAFCYTRPTQYLRGIPVTQSIRCNKKQRNATKDTRFGERSRGEFRSPDQRYCIYNHLQMTDRIASWGNFLTKFFLHTEMTSRSLQTPLSSHLPTGCRTLFPSSSSQIAQLAGNRYSRIRLKRTVQQETKQWKSRRFPRISLIPRRWIRRLARPVKRHRSLHGSRSLDLKISSNFQSTIFQRFSRCPWIFMDFYGFFVSLRTPDMYAIRWRVWAIT